MQLIILEGADGVGKTTLKDRALREIPNIHGGAHFSKPPDGKYDLEEYWQGRMRGTLPYGSGIDKDSTIIWDRSFIGNYIYGNYKKDQRALSLAQLFHLFSWLSTIFDKITVLALTCDAENIKDRLVNKKEDYITPEEDLEIQEKYRKLITGWLQNYIQENKLPVHLRLLLNNTQDHQDYIFNLIKQCATQK